MAKPGDCSVCDWETANGVKVDTSRTMTSWGNETGTSRTAVKRHLGHPPIYFSKALENLQFNNEYQQNEHGDITITMRCDRIVPLSEWLQKLVDDGQDPDQFLTSHKHSIWGQQSNENGLTTLYANSFSAVRRHRDGALPKWPLIHPTREPYVIRPITRTPRASRFKTAVVGADTQIGYDIDAEGVLTPYHDERAIDIFYQVLEIEQPDQSILAGDILDLTEQSRWPQEAGFARSTQPALEYTRQVAAEMRARTPGRVVWIEGNHDKRMSSFMETNALAAMGLRKAGYPDSYPVMSIPNLIGLDEFDVEYVDAYPAGVHWITDGLRVIHGTKANAAGSTASQYANEMPHISTVFGHTHRQEVQSKTTFDRAGKIKTFNVNPGCLCRVDGIVPSVHGARHIDGSKATYFESWQQGVTVIRYLDDGTAFFEMIQIEEGSAMHLGQELVSH